MAKLESLIVDMQVNTAQLRAGLDEAKARLKGLEDAAKNQSKALEGIAGSMKKAFAAVISVEVLKGVAEFIAKGAELGAQMQKLSQAAGISVESMSRLSYAANLSNVSTEELGTAMNHLNRKLGEAASGSAEANALFRTIGVTVRDATGNMRSSDAILGDLAQHFAGFNDSANKSALAMAVFGKAGAELLPLLNRGSSGIAQLEQESDKLGVTLDSKTGAAAAEFEEGMKRLKLVGEGLSAHFAAALAPTLEELEKRFVTSKDGAENLKKASEGLAQAVGAIASAAASAIAALADLAKKGQEVFGPGTRAHLTPEAQAILDENSNSLALPTTHLADLGKPTGTRKTAAPAPPSLKGISEAEQALKSLQKTLRDLKVEGDSLGQGPIAKMIDRLKEGDLSEELKKAGAAAKGMSDQILQAAKNLLDAQLDTEKMKLDFEAIRSGNALTQQLSERRQSFGFGGAQLQLAAARTAGFENFDQALNALAEETKKQVNYQNEAKLRENRDTAGAQRMQLLADAAGEAAAYASKAADAFVELGDRVRELSKTIGGQLQLALEGLFNKLGGGRNPDGAAGIAGTIAGKFSNNRLGELVNTGMQGGAAGGPWGAIAGVALDLLSQSKQFGQLMQVVNLTIQDLSDTLGLALEPIITIAGAGRDLTQAFDRILRPVVTHLTPVLEDFAPFLEMLAMAFDALAPVVEAVTSVTSVLLDKALRALFDAMKWITVTILNLGAAIGTFVKNLGYTIASIGYALGDNDVGNAIAKAGNSIAGFGTTLEGAKATADKLWNTTFDDMMATAKHTAAVSANTSLFQQLNQQLTNVPEGFKTNLARFNAMAGGAGPGSDGWDGGSGNFGNSLGQAMTGTTQKGTTNVNVDGPAVLRDLVDLLINRIAQGQYVRTGSGVLP